MPGVLGVTVRAIIHWRHVHREFATRGAHVSYRTGSRRSRVFGALLAVALVAVGAAACGDDEDGATTTAADGTAAPTDGGDSAAAADEVAALIERPTEIANTAAFDGEVPADKTIMWIQCPVPACIQLAEPLRDGVEALGWSLEVVPHDGTPEGVKAAYAQAVREKPDAVVSSGFPRVMFEEELAQLAAAEIPVVQMTVVDEPTDGITAVVHGPKRNAEAGRQLALYTVADADGPANVLWVTTAFPIVVPTLEGVDGEGGFQPTLQKYCPDCSMEVLDIPIESIGVDDSARVVAALQSNPDIDYVVGPLGDMFIGLPGALADAGIADQVTLVTHDQNPALSAAVEDGTIEAVVGFPGPENMFQIVDTLLRYFAGVDFEASYDDMPGWIITQGEVPSTTEDYPLIEDYQEQYKALWGVG